ncbi:DUF2809 domain-containing protein [Hanstruepera neustonica]|uniref:DUF2809 domain-containing protein n=1 Tax=Hanstruepera neustonica TaxID=1445657 RepID=A0A2K1E0F2_9FLAO|nr:DUF2809 domain-containing protein [Hanstruepera neustonica]PNQ73763.1 DUF2809 domain-containing protein [Hanstruepera neustonica]
MKLHFKKSYFIYFIVLFITEVLIAIYLKSGFIRHTFGDVLVVILIYCFVKSFIDIRPIPLALSVLLFAFIIEFLQLFNFLEFLGLQHNNMAALILGSTFQVSDLVAYSTGSMLILIFEKLKH